MVDKRVAQFPKTLKPIDRLVYFTMLDGADYYESKFTYRKLKNQSIPLSTPYAT